jgi:hypothetical protein
MIFKQINLGIENYKFLISPARLKKLEWFGQMSEPIYFKNHILVMCSGSSL